jgi:16S rRNA (guanine966-N2)-methyltransferase
VRETLFNWLSPVIDGSRCLDCFAGSGVLGLEAASRGAALVVQLERDVVVARQLRANASELAARQVQVHCADALDWLRRSPTGAFDVCFLDPPFAADLLTPALARLTQHGWLVDGGLVYVETARKAPLPELPLGWRWLRDQCAGQVRYALAEVGALDVAGAPDEVGDPDQVGAAGQAGAADEAGDPDEVGALAERG